MSSNIINDIFDMNTDGINRPARVLIQNSHLFKFLFKYSWLNDGVSIYTFIFLKYTFSFNNFNQLPFLILYSKIFKNIPIIGNILVSFFLALILLFVAIASENSIINILPEAFIAFTISLIREIVKGC